VMTDISYGVIIDQDMLGKVSQLKYVNHDITDISKFLELALGKYLGLKLDPVTNQPIHVPKVWAKRLERVGILNLFEITHFFRSQEVKSCVKMMLTCVHGGYLWLD